MVTTDEKGKPLQPQNVPIEIELFKPDTQWVSSRNSFPSVSYTHLNPVYQAGKQPEPQPGVHNSGWARDPGDLYYKGDTACLLYSSRCV